MTLDLLPARRRGRVFEAVFEQVAEAHQKLPAIGRRKLAPRRGRLAGGYGRGEALLEMTLLTLLSFEQMGGFEPLHQRQ